jgi:hypothetical protein
LGLYWSPMTDIDPHWLNTGDPSTWQIGQIVMRDGAPFVVDRDPFTGEMVLCWMVVGSGDGAATWGAKRTGAP